MIFVQYFSLNCQAFLLLYNINFKMQYKKVIHTRPQRIASELARVAMRAWASNFYNFKLKIHKLSFCRKDPYGILQ